MHREDRGAPSLRIRKDVGEELVKVKDKSLRADPNSIQRTTWRWHDDGEIEHTVGGGVKFCSKRACGGRKG